MLTAQPPSAALIRKPTEFAAVLSETAKHTKLVAAYGRVQEVMGTVVKATVPGAQMGDLSILQTPGQPDVAAEIIGFTPEHVLLAPIGELRGVSPATLVRPCGFSHRVGIGQGLLGRVLDGFGRPIDGGGDISPSGFYPVHADAPHPLRREPISRQIAVGVRAIDGLLACGEGQRVGIFAAAGCGKSTLMGMLAKSPGFDVIVIALVGERGREIREFIERELGSEGLKRAVLVCSTSDKSPMERLKGGFVATAIAEYFRDRGLKVLLLMDSLTRLARAQRELGLMAGEPPARRGFPPSVFAMLPKLLERAGSHEFGSITAFYTVLVEGDDMNEPVADESRSILDGHIILSRKLAAAGHFPAISILDSTSRVMNAIVPAWHRASADKLRALLAKHEDVELLVRLGEYEKGSDSLADEAIARIDRIRSFLRQPSDQSIPLEQALKELKAFSG